MAPPTNSPRPLRWRGGKGVGARGVQVAVARGHDAAEQHLEPRLLLLERGDALLEQVPAVRGLELPVVRDERRPARGGAADEPERRADLRRARERA